MCSKFRVIGQSGMTLLEVLVAMSIFSIIAIAAYTALETGLTIQSRLKQERDFWRTFETVVQVLENDLSQAVNRSPRIPGAGERPAFRGAQGNRSQLRGEFLRFTSGGFSSFRSGPASPYRRIAYQLREQTLYRTVWAHPDMPYGLEGAESALLDDLEEIRLRYLIGKRWVNNWNLDAYQINSDDLPKALEIRLEFKDGDKYLRVFHVGTAI